jgi:hypothetical protein
MVLLMLSGMISTVIIQERRLCVFPSFRGAAQCSGEPGIQQVLPNSLDSGFALARAAERRVDLRHLHQLLPKDERR